MSFWAFSDAFAMVSDDAEEEKRFLKNDMCFAVWNLGRDDEEIIVDALELVTELEGFWAAVVVVVVVVVAEEAKREEMVGRGASRDDDVTDDAIDLLPRRIWKRNAAAGAEPERRLWVVRRRIRGRLLLWQCWQSGSICNWEEKKGWKSVVLGFFFVWHASAVCDLGIRTEEATGDMKEFQGRLIS
jgi:hypothetical protein